MAPARASLRKLVRTAQMPRTKAGRQSAPPRRSPQPRRPFAFEATCGAIARTAMPAAPTKQKRVRRFTRASMRAGRPSPRRFPRETETSSQGRLHLSRAIGKRACAVRTANAYPLSERWKCRKPSSSAPHRREVAAPSGTSSSEWYTRSPGSPQSSTSSAHRHVAHPPQRSASCPQASGAPS